VSFLESAAISLPASRFPSLAVGFFGLGTGYLIYGPQEHLVRGGIEDVFAPARVLIGRLRGMPRDLSIY